MEIQIAAPVAITRLEKIRNLFNHHPPFTELSGQLTALGKTRHTVTGLAGSTDAMLIASLSEQVTSPVLVATAGPDQASDLYDDLSFLLGDNRIGHFPSRQILPYDFKAPVGEVMGRRISTLDGLISGSLAVVVTSARALIEPTIAWPVLQDRRVHLATGAEADMDDLVQRLVMMGFSRVPVVGEVGDFAVRGGLIDFFTPGFAAPVRVEFFGDEVETIRQFDVTTQRTIEHLDSVTLLPRREIPITQESLEEYLSVLPEHDAEFIRSRYLNDPDLPGLEWLSILFGIKQGGLLDYLPDQALVMTMGEGAITSEFEAIMAEADGLYQRLSDRFSKLPTPQEYYHDFDTITASLNKHSVVDVVPFRGGRKDIIDFAIQPHPALGSRLDLLGEVLADYQSSGMTYLIASDTKGQADRLQHLFSERDEIGVTPPIEVADLKGGFVCAQSGFALLTDHEIFGRYHRRTRKKRYKEGVAITDYSNLVKGDIVVHTEHGLARYLGLETIKVDQRSRDCLLLQYAENDRLYVPIEEFNRVSKYSGKDTDPQLTRLGGPGWEKLKKKTRKALEILAKDLIELYAQRKAESGHSFGPDTVWLKQLEASFPYEETEDQFRAIEDVKADMASDNSMDRLICGDVGFGKTEVAVRAAFKAIENGKQVAVLVPTTVLAQQHLQTFSERLSELPVRIEMLSRFRKRKEQLEVVKDLAEGKVDLVIGTHRLFSKDVSFRDLGLLVVDEEHRFGVRHKERLRKIRVNVDTISMSATPIPRTLQLSLMSVRDMSLISTSPRDRLPITTEIVEFDPVMIATVILREVDRGGQVFFVHNRVQTIDAMYRYLKKLLPQVEIGIGHGQMHERSLEGVMLGFLSRRFDVLLCTSIIESGLDIPNANTIIINRADRFGLAQLYQLRGRVGRSARRAYSYLLTPPMRLLAPDAIKRLRALEAHSDLGSGFALAMRDLEIRGAGTILGARQSGYIEDIGFDMYNKLLEEAIATAKGEELQRLPETKIDTNYELYLSDQYVNDRQHKVDIYRRIADSRSLETVEKIRDEVIDRFGKLPQSADNLFEAAAVKISASALEIERVVLRGGKARLLFNEGKTFTRSEVESLRRATDCPMQFSLAGQAEVSIDLGAIGTSQRLNYLRNILAKV